MSQWKNTDSAANSVLWAGTGYNLAPNSSNRTAMFGNVTQSAIVSGLTVGQFGVDPTEIGVGNGPVSQVIITFAGSGYTATSLSSISGGGGSGANVSFAQTGGRLTTSTINSGGSSYESNPTITVYAPSAITFNGNTAVSGNSITLSSANSKFLVNDVVTLSANVTSLPGGLTNGTSYYVVLANTTVVQLSTSAGGSAIALTKASGDNTTAGGASLTGQTATAVAVVGGAQNKGVSHAGWVVRKVGTGNRAGRVQYETLVAMGSMSNSTDASDDSILPDS